MSRIFLSHSSRNNRQALALKQWLIEAEPGLANEIFLDLDPITGIAAGVRWKDALRRASGRCEAVICVLSRDWASSPECIAEYRHAEDLGKPIFCARVEPIDGNDVTREWQRCDLFGDGPTTAIDVDDTGDPVVFQTEGLQRLQAGLRAAGIAAESFPWPPPGEPDRAPYRGWQPLEAVDAAVYFGRDTQIVRAMDALRSMRNGGVARLMVILGPSGVGKSSFLRAGLLPRLHRDDRNFLTMPVLRPEQHALTGEHGLAHGIYALRRDYGMATPSLGDIKARIDDPECVREWLLEAQHAACQRFIDPGDAAAPTLILPVDQAEELFGADAGEQARQLLAIFAHLLATEAISPLSMIVVATIRADRHEPLLTAPELANVDSRVFDDLKPMPLAQFKEVICGPSRRTVDQSGLRVDFHPALVDQLLADCAHGADTLPLLSLTLARLYEDYGSNGEIGIEQYHAMGGLDRVVQSEIDALLATAGPHRQDQLDRLHAAFIPWLVTVTPDNDQPMRRAARWQDLPAESHSLMDRFVARRLLVKDERDGRTVVEVALESLLRQWDQLTEWLRIEADDLREADTLERAAAAWERTDRNADWLLEGSRLVDAETLSAKAGFRDRLNSAREYLLASRQHADQRAEAELQAAHSHAHALRRRSRLLMAVLALVVAAALVAVLGFVQATNARSDAESRTRDATANELVADAVNDLGQLGHADDETAMQLILAARTFPSRNAVEYPLLSALQTERDLLKIIDARAPVAAVAFRPDGGRIASAGLDTTVRIWDAHTGQSIGQPWRGHDEHIGVIHSVVFSPDGRQVATASSDKTVRIWDADTGRPVLPPLLHEDKVFSVVFSPDGRRLATAGADKTVRIWDAQTGQPIGAPLRGYNREVTALSFSPDGRRLASASWDGTVRIWDTETRQLVMAPLTSDQQSLLTDIAFSPDGHRIAVSGWLDSTVKLWDADTGLPTGQLSGHKNVVNSVAFSKDGYSIATGSDDSTVRLWDARTNQPLGPPLVGHQSPITGVAFSPDGKRIATGSLDDAVRIWDPVSARPLVGHQDFVLDVAISPDGKRIVSAGADGTVRRWDAETHRPIGDPMTGHEGWVTSVAFSSDGRGIVSAGADGTVRRWDAETGMPTAPPLTAHDQVVAMAVSNDGRRIATAGEDTTVRLWDAETLAPVGAPFKHDAPVIAVVFSPDGRRIATSSLDDTIRLWDSQTGQVIAGPVGTAAPSHVQFRPDGGEIFVYSRTLNKVERLDSQTLRRSGGAGIYVDGGANAVVISPNRSVLAAGSGDGTVQLRYANGAGSGPALSGHDSTVTSLAFSPDSTFLVSGSLDRTVRIWPMPTVSPETLCAKLTENMSHKLWNGRLPGIAYHPQCPGLPIPPD